MKRKKGNQLSSSDICALLFCIAALAFMLRVFGAPSESSDAQGSGELVHLVRSLAADDIRASDGDTIEIDLGGDRPPLRLLQVNAPELEACFGERARARLQRVIDDAGKLRVRYDSELGARRFGRTLGYLYADGRNINLDLVRRGYAVPYFIGGERGDHARRIQRAAAAARRERRGLYGACRALPARR